MHDTVRIRYCASRRRKIHDKSSYLSFHTTCNTSSSSTNPSSSNPHIFAFSSSNTFFNPSISVSRIGHPIPSPSFSFGFGIIWKCTWSTTWCAIGPLFCRILNCAAPVAWASFLATGCLPIHPACRQLAVTFFSSPLSVYVYMHPSFLHNGVESYFMCIKKIPKENSPPKK